jgi:hypothetical protein
MHIPPG